MTKQLTLSIIKPDGVNRNLIGQINTIIENSGLQIISSKMMIISKDLAEKFYDEHKSKPFFGELVDYITSAPVLVQTLSGNNAIALYREVMGATNPSDAASDTIRGKLGISIDKNTVHGSDSPQSAAREIELFFKQDELYLR